jgi:hypothetical protein
VCTFDPKGDYAMGWDRIEGQWKRRQRSAVRHWGKMMKASSRPSSDNTSHKPCDYVTGPGMENKNEGAYMIKIVSITILAGGIILLLSGINAYDSTSSDISRLFTGSATDKSIWLLVGGVVVTALGLAGLWRGSKTA